MSDPALSEKGLPFRSDEQNTGSGVCQSGIRISISHEAKPQAALAGMSQADETLPSYSALASACPRSHCQIG